jgi:hypothetical protein
MQNQLMHRNLQYHSFAHPVKVLAATASSTTTAIHRFWGAVRVRLVSLHLEKANALQLATVLLVVLRTTITLHKTIMVCGNRCVLLALQGNLIYFILFRFSNL